MNKKIVKWILIIFGILVVLGLGLGIFGYNAIKNRNNDKNVVENENDLKEVASLKKLGAIKPVTDITNDGRSSNNIVFRYNMTNIVDTCQLYTGGSSKCYTKSAVGSLYYLSDNTEKKLDSSWIFFHYENTSSSSSVPSGLYSLSYMNYNFSGSFESNPVNYIYQIGNYLIVSLSTLRTHGVSTSTFSSGISSYPYTKIFYIGNGSNFGKLIYTVPTNGNEKISIIGNSTCDHSKGFKNNLCFGSDAVYYLESNYSDGSDKADIHKVTFGSTSFDSYKDEVVSTVGATITLNASYKV